MCTFKFMQVWYHRMVVKRALSLVSILESLTMILTGGIYMSKEKKLTPGNRESARAFLDALSTSVVIPASVTVVDSKSGIINEGQENQRTWASLTCVDKKLYETFASIGQEDYCPTFKVKLKNYQSENLDSLINADITVNNYDVAFVFDKIKQPIGLALVAELADITLK